MLPADPERLIDAFSKDFLSSSANANAQLYRSAQPFPHIVLDNFFPEVLMNELRNVSAEYPDGTADQRGCLNGRWKQCFPVQRRESFVRLQGDPQLLSQRLPAYKEDIYKKGWVMNPKEEAGKNTAPTLDKLEPHSRKIYDEIFHKEQWRRFLTNLTGIEGLLADGQLMHGGGIHGTVHGGHLNVHADFNQFNSLRRRVNMFVFLNEDWKEEYGGHLELWSRDLQQCEKRILPIFGRLVIFSTSDYSYHGHPHPLNAPGRVRRSIAQYYYTRAAPPKNECVDDCTGRGHSTLWQKPKCVCPLSKDINVAKHETQCSA